MSDDSRLLTWWEPAFGEEEARAVAEVVRGGFVNEGKVSARFAEAVQQRLGVKYAHPTCNGTVALYLALKAVGVGPGDEVIVPALSFIATANAVVLADGIPVFADIREADLNIDPDDVRARITDRTRAIMPVHVNGRAADMKALKEIAATCGAAVVEDAAQALGSRIGGRAMGTLGDVGCVSLAPTKMITAAQGGLVLTDRDDVHEAVTRLKDHGRLSRKWNYHPEVGFNFKFNDVLAALALVQLDRLDGRLRRAQQHFLTYERGLADVPQLRFVPTDVEGGAVPLWVDAVVAEGRAEFIEAMRARNIVCRPFWPAMHLQAAYPRDGEPRKVTEYVADHGIWFPSGAGKSDPDLARVISEVREHFAG